MAPRARRLVFALAALSTASACAAPVTSTPAPTAVDTLFYISARDRAAESGPPQLAAALEYGVVMTRRPRLDDPTSDGARIAILDSVLLTREAFIAALQARVPYDAPAQEFAVLYTHGYGTSLHNLWEHSALARLRSRGEQPWIVFAWPSIGSGVAWPREGEILTSAYRQDSAAAAASRGKYAEALTTVHEAIGGARLLPVAHSLGGQLVGETLREDVALRARLSSDPLRALAFVSPDVEMRRFGEVLVPAVRPLTQRLLLYASADDRVLFFSERVNDSFRAGRVREVADGPAVFEGLESVDMTDGQYANSWIVNAFGTRHALRRKSAALFDLVHLVGAQRDASCRQSLGTAERLTSGAWRLTPVEVPSPRQAAACSSFGS
jgi:esterase/lipase superfamily enzyme